jgi:glycosyltransferase involved in cell wall biosynthesis
MTRDRDLGLGVPYSEQEMARTRGELGCEINYLAPGWKGGQQLIKTLMAFRPDVVYLNSCFSPLMTQLPLLFESRLSTRFLLAPRGELLSSALASKSFKKAGFLALARWAHWYRGVQWHATCDAEADSIREQGLGDARVYVVSDLPQRQPNGQGPILGKSPGSLNLLYLARLHPMKGLHRLLDLLPSLTGRVHLRVVGPEVDIDYAARCRRSINQLPENINVIWEGPLPHEASLATYGEAHLYILPTESENHGYTIQESLMAGCPVLTSTGTPWNRLEADGAGWTLPLESTDRWKMVLQHMVDQDDPEHQILRRAALRHGQQSTEAEAVLQATRAMFHAVARSHA